MKDIFLLDLDETLLDFSKAERENFFSTLKTFSLPVNDGIYARFHVINEGLWKLLEKGEIERERLKVRRFELLFEEYGISADAEKIAKFYFDNFCNICCPYEGAKEFLATLKERGRVYIVTNGAAHIQYRHIEDAGFAPYLAGVFISQEVGADKPSKAFADHVKAHIPDFQNERAVWLGDSLSSDMGCAKNAGIDFILYCHAGMPAGYEGRAATNYSEALQEIFR